MPDKKRDPLDRLARDVETMGNLVDVPPSPIRVVVWKDEGDFGFITAYTQDDLDHQDANPGRVGVPYDPNRIRAYGSVADARALALEHDADLRLS